MSNDKPLVCAKCPSCNGNMKTFDPYWIVDGMECKHPWHSGALVCAKCGYQWTPRVVGRDPKTIKECPDCKSRKWRATDFLPDKQ
jgi:hypothetical protein